MSATRVATAISGARAAFFMGGELPPQHPSLVARDEGTHVSASGDEGTHVSACSSRGCACVRATQRPSRKAQLKVASHAEYYCKPARSLASPALASPAGAGGICVGEIVAARSVRRAFGQRGAVCCCMECGCNHKPDSCGVRKARGAAATVRASRLRACVRARARGLCCCAAQPIALMCVCVYAKTRDLILLRSCYADAGETEFRSL